MSWLAALTVVVPLLASAALAALGQFLPRRLIDAVSILISLAITLAGLTLARFTQHGPLDLWLGGWRPRNGVALGVSFHVDPFGACFLAFIGFLFFCAFLFSWRYFEEIKGFFHALMLVFLAAMAGFSLTGDLFNLFVWFELMTAAAIALCGYKSEEEGPLQGALHLAVINTIGAFLALTGVALVYSATGALNLVQIGQALQRPGLAGNVLVTVSFALVALGFLVKAAIVPFHFWLADAHAVAPTPVCMLFSGVMVELGLYAVFRVHWTAYASALPDVEPKIRAVFLVAGAMTALIGAIQSLLQTHLKRLLAYSTISHMGIMTCGFALLSAKATTGTALYVLGHGGLKAALFASVGILLDRYGTLDELELQRIRRRERARGERLPRSLVLVYFICACGLSGVPPFSTFMAEAWIDEAAKAGGMHWLALISLAAAALTCAAVLRVGARVLLGFGDADERNQNHSTPRKSRSEAHAAQGRVPTVMLAPGVILAAFSVIIAWLPGVASVIRSSAQHLHASAANLPGLLFGQPIHWGGGLQEGAFPPLAASALHGSVSLLISAILVGGMIYPASFVRKARSWVGKVVHPLTKVLHDLHSGAIGDALAWFAFGVAVYAGYLAWPGSAF